MFRLIKQIFISTMTLLSSLLNVNPLECISMKNRECKVRAEIVNIKSNNPKFSPFSIKVNKCNGNCNNISDLYARIYAPDTVKDLNIKVFNLMVLTNETRHMKWYESCKCISRSDKIICISKQRWNEDKCRCECKEFIDKGVCDKGFIWNPSNCVCECDKSCSIGEYLDYSDCKCRKKLADPLVEEWTENIDEGKLVNITVENKNIGRCNSYLVYMVLFFKFFIIIILIGIYFVYHKYVNRINMICIINHNIKWRQ